MSLHVAIEITNKSLLVAVAEPSVGGARATISLKTPLPEGAGAEQIASALRTELPDVRWGKAKLIVVAGDDTQLRQLALPPAPAEELPDMVRLIAGKELNATEGDPVDFLPLRSDGQGTAVIAAKIDASVIATAQAVANELDASLAGVVFRPCAAAALVRRLAPENAAGRRIVVALSSGGADIVALLDGDPMLIRTTRGGAPTAIQADLRRTLPAANRELGGTPESITTLGSPAEKTTLSSPAGEMVMRVVDLAETAFTRDAVRDKDVAKWGPLVGVLGAAIDSATGDTPAIDFTNPRRPGSAAPDRRRQLVLAVTAAAALIAGVFTAYGRLAAMDREIADLELATNNLEKSIETFAPYEAQVGQIKRWEATDVIWLDELESISRRLRPKPLSAKDYPAEEDAYLTSLQFRPPADSGSGGLVEIRAFAKQKSTPGLIEQRLRDDRHAVQPMLVTDRSSGEPYPIEFRTLVRVERQVEAPADQDSSDEEGEQ